MDLRLYQFVLALAAVLCMGLTQIYQFHRSYHHLPSASLLLERRGVGRMA